MADSKRIIEDLQRQLDETRQANTELVWRLTVARTQVYTERGRAETSERLSAFYHAMAVEALGEDEVRRRYDAAFNGGGGEPSADGETEESPVWRIG